jgi:DNA-directed RNA polymerase sigma subunit (sigma70/sigma32)
MENQRGNGERTFEEIGRALNIEASTAQAVYTSGMRKLRSRSRTPLFQNLLSLALEADGLRQDKIIR